MVVIINGGRDCRVVIVPFCLGDLAIVVLVPEVGQELQEGLVVGDLSRDHSWMEVGRVDHSQVCCSDIAGSIEVELIESLVDHVLPGRGQSSPDSHEELIEVDGAISISVEVRQKEIGLLLGEVAAALIESYEELLCVDLPISVIIESLEDPAEPSDGLGSSLIHLCSDLLNDCRGAMSMVSETYPLERTSV